jgi:hypothetical protein
MYKALVRRRIHAVFDALSHADYAVAMDGMADDVHHVFAGDSALGGERHSRNAVRALTGRSNAGGLGSANSHVLASSGCRFDSCRGMSVMSQDIGDRCRKTS